MEKQKDEDEFNEPHLVLWKIMSQLFSEE